MDCVAFRFIPREERFFDDFVALAEQIRKGAGLLKEMLAPERPIRDKADEIRKSSTSASSSPTRSSSGSIARL